MGKSTITYYLLQASMLLSVTLLIGACSTAKNLEAGIVESIQVLEKKLDNCSNN